MLTKEKKSGRTIVKFLLQYVNKIQFKLIAAFILPIAGIIALGVISYNTASKIIISNYEDSMSQTLDMTGQYYAYTLRNVEADLNEYYQHVEIRDFYKGLYSVTPRGELELHAKYQTSMEEQVWKDPLIDEIYILSDYKSFLTTKAKDDKLYSKYIESSEGQALLADNSKYYWFIPDSTLDTLLDSKSGTSGLRVGRLLKTTSAILIADINRKELVSILNRLDMGDASHFALVTPDGYEFKTDNETAEGEATDNIFYGQDFYEEAINGEKASDVQYVKYDNESYLFMYNKIGETGLVVCSLIPKANILSKVSTIKSTTAIIVLITCIISSVICSIIVGGIGNTIRYMKKKLKQVSEGDLTVEIKTKRQDEFASLAHDINNMILNMKDLIQKVKDVGMELVSTIDLLAITSKTFVDTTKNIQGAVGEIESGIIQLDENSADCLNQMSTLSDKIKLVHDNTDRISKISNNTGEAIEEGIQTMDDLNTKVQDTTLITERVINTIMILEEKTKQIGSIMAVINEISEQTNLLSLNASIESARAGAAGKGFAVIAGEIRKLSDNTLNSSKQIQKLISEIVQNIYVAVNTAKEAEVIVQLQKTSVNNTAQSFNIMSQQINELVSEANAILKNAMNMEEARKTTEDAIQSISAVSEETTACSDTVNSTVASQIETVGLVDSTINKLIQNADTLKDSINRFICE